MTTDELFNLPPRTLEAELEAHNRRYWDQNAPSISDYDYDRLVERLRSVNPHAAVLQAMGPAEGRIGQDVRHGVVPMLSLDKAYDEQSLLSWVAKFSGGLVMSPKVDGLAVSLRYGDQGELVLAATRGDGVAGEDVTTNARRIVDIPRHIPTRGGVEVRGEIYLPLSAFKALAGEFANPRNTAAGALKQKDPERCARVGLRFFAYDLVGLEVDTELEKHALLKSFGFTSVEHDLVKRDEVQAGYERYVARRASLNFEIDGVVFKANDVAEQERLGFTSHHPRFAIAYKLQGDSATTRLLDVEWSVSRTGVLTPVGIVEPVLLSGATVTRISLHHWGLVQAKNLSLGAEVVAMRRGGVIPHLETLVTPGDRPIVAPKVCPACGAPARVEGDQVVCTTPGTCGATAVGQLGHFVKATGIEGFGEVWLDTLVERGLLKSPADLYRLKERDLLSFDRMGETLAKKLISQIQAARTLPLPTFLISLGVPYLGKTASLTVARAFTSLKTVRAARPSQLVALPKFGELLANKVVTGLAERAAQIDDLLQYVTVSDETSAAVVDGPFSGKSFLFTGTLAAMKREAAQEKVEALGGKAASGVGKELSFLVVGAEGKAGSKLEKANKLGVRVLTEAQFIALLVQHAQPSFPEIFCRVESDPASGIPEFISKDGLGYDAEDLDGAEIYQPQQGQGL